MYSQNTQPLDKTLIPSAMKEYTPYKSCKLANRRFSVLPKRDLFGTDNSFANPLMMDSFIDIGAQLKLSQMNLDDLDTSSSNSVYSYKWAKENVSNNISPPSLQSTQPSNRKSVYGSNGAKYYQPSQRPDLMGGTDLARFEKRGKK
jgi:hypothetical protein